MRKYLLSLFIVCQSLISIGQVDLEAQLNDLAQALPTYYLGYSKVILNNLGMPMAQSSQMQHWKKKWKVKYGLSIATQAFGINNNTNGRIEYNDLYHSPTISYVGSMSNAFGADLESGIRFYLLDENQDKIINPLSGKYLFADILMPSGLNQNLGAVPFIAPSLEIRLWKGLIISGSYTPLSWFVREFEQEEFKFNSSFYNVGLALNMRNFTMVPVLSWLRFDGSYGKLNVELSDFQDAVELDNTDLFAIDFNEINIITSTDFLQYRASIAVPVLKKAKIIAQIGSIQSNFSFDFNYDIGVSVDADKLKEDYNVDFESDEIEILDGYSVKEANNVKFYYGAGLLFDTKVATFYFGYADLSNPTFVVKTSLRL